ncbi:hypothetical protein Q9Q95_01605 [Sphingomonas sp. DG1-23]|uniref:hypothetical protein n=1 Tax=Sphingomonas sp. DG1-23 TaxID=3068316 RepID=UPI00273D0C34|nr:hypothetical protein [Sphingomonas sp. DG1-23]MDP5277604.1 hypothetical protein [Sphingomonas sp. DG1-23]
MQNRVPVPRAARPDLPDFPPVPRKCNRHDGWTPARQKAFIDALADTGSVRRAAAMVNMSQANAYALRRAAGAEGFRRAWDSALDFGLARLKDLAFERAIEGELVPVFVGGKLMGFRRKHNDALLIFCLRHYGRDASGKRTTINYFSTRASAGAASGGIKGAGAQASATTMRTVIHGDGGSMDAALRDDEHAAALAGFAGVTLDAEAEAAVAAAITACAERRAAADAAIAAGGEEAADAAGDDPGEPFIPLPFEGTPYRGTLEPPVRIEEAVDWVPAADEADGAPVMPSPSPAAPPIPGRGRA